MFGVTVHYKLGMGPAGVDSSRYFRSGFLHRYIKPANILLDSHGSADPRSISPATALFVQNLDRKGRQHFSLPERFSGLVHLWNGR